MSRSEFDPLDVFLLLEPSVPHRSVTVHRTRMFQPPTDLYETPEKLVVRMDLAGVAPDNLSITLAADDRYLTVSGTRKEPAVEQENATRVRCHHLEIFYGTFERQIVLPTGVRFDREAITASYTDGFLVISLPKTSTRQEKHRIEITG